MLHRWLSRRALVLHLMLVVIFPFCLLAGWWQANRAFSGNTLSYLYAIEWPIFSGFAVYGWWQLIHDVAVPGRERTRRAPTMSLDREDVVPTRPLVWDPALETPAMQAYNEYLKTLHSGGARKSWGNPRGLPS